MYRKVTAALAAGFMLFTNVMTPITAFAGEESVQAADTGSEKTETQAAFYYVTIPYFNEMDVNYDSKRLKENRSDGSMVLEAKANEDIDLKLMIHEHYSLNQIQAVRSSGKEAELFWKDESTITFSMPEEDVRLQASFHEILPEVTEEPVMMEETVPEENSVDGMDGPEPGNEANEVRDEPIPDANAGSEEQEARQEAAGEQEEASGEPEETTVYNEAAMPAETDAEDGAVMPAPSFAEEEPEMSKVPDMVVKIIKVICLIPIWVFLTMLQVVCIAVSACSEVLSRVLALFMYAGLFVIYISKVRPVSEILYQAGIATIFLFIPDIATLLAMGVTWIKAKTRGLKIV